MAFLYPILLAAALSKPVYGQPQSPASTQVGPYGLDNAKCEQQFYTVDANSTNMKFVGLDQTNQNQTVATSLLELFSVAPSNLTETYINGTFSFSKSYNLSGTLCVPAKGAKEDSAIQILVHGVSGDSSYWDFDLAPEYSKHAASHGYTTFRYDRLGCGLSETPVNGYDEVQAPTEVAILKSFIELLRNTSTIGGKSWSKVVGIGHSYGAVQTQAISHAYPELYDAVVLQGFTANLTFLPNTFQAFGLTIGSTVLDLPQLADKPPVWLATASLATNQMPFWHWPFYAQTARTISRQHEYGLTLGSVFSLSAVGGIADEFRKPLLFLIGDKDFIFAGGDAYAGPNGQSIPAASAALLYPNAQAEIYIAANTGHLTTQHYSAPEIHEATLDFIARQGL